MNGNYPLHDDTPHSQRTPRIVLGVWKDEPFEVSISGRKTQVPRMISGANLADILARLIEAAPQYAPYTAQINTKGFPRVERTESVDIAQLAARDFILLPDHPSYAND